LAYRRTPDHSLDTDTFAFVTLEEMLKNSDMVTIHCPLNAQTENLINQKTITMMKNSVLIINTSRGAVLNEADVVQALNSGKIKMIAVDVLAVEPPEYNNQMIFHKNCIVTPHIAWMPKETRIRLLEIAAKNLDCFLSGKPQNIVN
ncbi:MAG: NAD(P)-dependent oxidoreductase, partial [Oscillospiraceae bacterium]